MASVPKFESTPAYSPDAEPAGEIALLFPYQGDWSIDDYLDLTEQSNQIIEYTAGRIEVLETPTIQHQRILIFLLTALRKIEASFVAWY